MFKIVFVDDEPLILDGLKKIIDWEEFGISVVGTATNIEDAMIIIKSFKPEIIITDIRLQGYNGLEMIEVLKQNGFKGEIIILSGYADFEYAQRAIEYGVCGYLLKPVNVGKLEKLVSQITEKLKTDMGFSQSEENSIEVVVKYVNEHFTEDITLSELAMRNHYEIATFSRKFKKYTGRGFTDYVAGLRIEYAKRYLTDTTRSIEDITEIVGYKSVRYFREIFEKYTGVTPSKYRKGFGNLNETSVKEEN